MPDPVEQSEFAKTDFGSAVAERQAPTGFARVTRELRRRTADLLGIAIVLVVGLSLGGQLVEWWSTDASETTTQMRAAGQSAGIATAWDAAAEPVRLSFGNSAYTLHKEFVDGDPQHILALLVDRCNARLSVPAIPIEAAATPEEQRLLKQLAQTEPIQTTDDGGHIYQLDRSAPMVVGTRKAAHSREVDTPAAGHQRVVYWGIALPRNGQSWLVMNMDRSTSAGGPGGGLDIELPASCQTVLSLGTERGGAYTVFEGDISTDECRLHFERWLAAQSAVPVRTWNRQTSAWTARYHIQRNKWQYSIDIQLHDVGGRQCSGLISSVSIPPFSERSETP